jgi:transposase-like protein
MREKRHNDDAEFTREAIRLGTEKGDGVGETARTLGINAHRLSRGTREADTQQHAAFPGNGRVSPEPDA